MEGFGDPQWGVIGQHHSAATDVNAIGLACNVGDHDLGRTARQTDRIVMLRKPVAMVSQLIGELRQLGRDLQGSSRTGSGFDVRQIENGKWEHGHDLFLGGHVATSGLDEWITRWRCLRKDARAG